MSDRPTLKIGDKVQYDFMGKVGDTGTVIKVTPKRLHTGGSTAHIRVRWDSNGHEGTVEERSLKLMTAAPQPTPVAACPHCGGWTSYGGMSQYSKSKEPVEGRTGCSCS